MLEILQNFERTGDQLSPTALIVLGMVCVLTGLFIWLGGLGFRKVLVAVAGVGGGAICGFLIAGRNVILAMVLATVAVVIAIILEKIFITIMSAALAAFLGFAVLAGPYVEDAEGLKQTCSQMPLYSWVIISALIIIFIVAGFFFWRLTSALCCATLGTILVFAGMILLLSYKGSEPIGHISSAKPYYTIIFAAMVAFGTIEQLFLCRSAKDKLKSEKGANKDKEN